jgi:hypothetical protein
MSLMHLGGKIMPEVKTSEVSQGVDLRPQGEASETAVKAIMEKWRLTIEHEDEVAQQTQYFSYQPQFIQSTR